MLNVGGSVPRHGPLVRGLTIAFNKCPPLMERNQWRNVKKKNPATFISPLVHVPMSHNVAK